jgi:hypothetical protein
VHFFIGLANARTDGASGHPRLQIVSHVTPNVTRIEKRERGVADAQPAPGEGGDTKARQQKSEEGDATTNLLLKHPDATLATYV